MDKKAIETLAVNAVRDSIVVSDFLDQFIPDNDKEPSWDGSIYVYKHKGKTKEQLKGRLPVQVKGTENSDFSKEEISYPVSVSDLNNYLNNGGVIFFVVYIACGGVAKQIYYCTLTPIKLRSILFNVGKQKTKNITLKKFPTNVDERTTIVFNCLENCQKQASFSNATLYTLDELNQKGVLESITIPVSTLSRIDLKTALLKNEVYMYANIKGSAIPQPIDGIPQNIKIKEEKVALITIKDKLYYDKVILLQDADSTTTIIGESFSMIANKNDHSIKVKYKSSDKIRILATDLEFILAYIANRGFQYNGVEFPFVVSEADLSNFSIEDESKRLEYTKKIVQMLDTLGCKKDIDIKTLTDKDWRNIHYLITAFVDKKPVSGLKPDLPVILTIPVGKLKFIVALQKVDGQIGTYEISDFFNTDFAVVDERPDGEKVPISQFALLKADDLLKADNIRFEALLPSFQKTEYHRETFARTTLFLLDLISAYDKSNGRHEIINAAMDFSDWIMTAPEEDMDHNISLLNKLQIVKRLRSLNDDEEKELINIIEKPNVREDVLVGAYLLLDQQAAAKIHFNKLDKEQQDILKGYPIFYFWKS